MKEYVAVAAAAVVATAAAAFTNAGVSAAENRRRGVRVEIRSR